MSFSDTFQVLGQLFDHWEWEGWTISHVGRECGVAVSEEEVRTDVELQTPICTLIEHGSERTPVGESVAIDGDGALKYTVRTPLIPDDMSSTGLRLETTEVRTTVDGSLVVSLAISMQVSPGRGACSDEVDEEIPSPARMRAGDGQSESRAKSAKRTDPSEADEQLTPHEEEVDEDVEGDRIRRHRPEIPAFEDTAYLRDIYEAYETFAEMATEIDMDVTAETVRRYMIGAGVHEPTRYNTDSSAEDASEPHAVGDRQLEDGDRQEERKGEVGKREEGDGEEEKGEGEGDYHKPSASQATSGSSGDAPVVIADGIGLPDGLSADDFIQIVKNSRTLYEVQREMGVERTTARKLLKEYNLLDFVMGQLASESELYVTREEIVDRIRESVSP